MSYLITKEYELTYEQPLSQSQFNEISKRLFNYGCVNHGSVVTIVFYKELGWDLPPEEYLLLEELDFSHNLTLYHHFTFDRLIPKIVCIKCLCHLDY